MHLEVDHVRAARNESARRMNFSSMKVERSKLRRPLSVRRPSSLLPRVSVSVCVCVCVSADDVNLSRRRRRRRPTLTSQ